MYIVVTLQNEVLSYSIEEWDIDGGFLYFRKFADGNEVYVHPDKIMYFQIGYDDG